MLPAPSSRDVAPALPAYPRLTVAWAAVAYALVYLAWTRFVPASPEIRELAAAFFPVPLNAASTAIFLLAARRQTGSPETRRAMRLMGATGTLVVLGSVFAVGQLLVHGRLTAGTLSDLCFLASYPLNLLAFLALPGGEGRADRWKMLCDAGMVLSGAGVALWYFVLREVVPPGADPAAVTLALVYPLGDLLLVIGLITIALRRPAHGNRVAVRWLGIAASLMVVSDLAVNLLVVRTGHRSTLAIDALALACGLAQLVAAERFWQGPLTEVTPTPAQTLLAARLRALLPFAAAGATYALLLLVALRSWVAPLSGLALGALAVSVFLGARQLLAFRRNAAILAEAAVRASEARFRSLVQNSSDLIFQLDARGDITFASSSAARVLGYEPGALLGVELSALAVPEDAAQLESYVRMAADFPGISPALEWRFRRADGEPVQVEVIANNLLADPVVGGIVLNARDVGERKALLDQLAHQAFHDPLTGLANRALFYDRVSHALSLAHRQGRTVVVLFLDLDDFKQVNDTLGHAEGDRLLTMIATRLRACARATDTVARLGGDEFALLVEDQHDDAGGGKLIERIREQMSYPFTLAGTEVQVGASIGSATGHSGSVDDILRHADVAMYSAKRVQKGSHRAYDPSMLREEEISEG